MEKIKKRFSKSLSKSLRTGTDDGSNNKEFVHTYKYQNLTKSLFHKKDRIQIIFLQIHNYIDKHNVNNNVSHYLTLTDCDPSHFSDDCCWLI